VDIVPLGPGHGSRSGSRTSASSSASAGCGSRLGDGVGGTSKIGKVWDRGDEVVLVVETPL
jgi:hypothetical protein